MDTHHTSRTSTLSKDTPGPPKLCLEHTQKRLMTPSKKPPPKNLGTSSTLCILVTPVFYILFLQAWSFTRILLISSPERSIRTALGNWGAFMFSSQRRSFSTGVGLFVFCLLGEEELDDQISPLLDTKKEKIPLYSVVINTTLTHHYHHFLYGGRKLFSLSCIRRRFGPPRRSLGTNFFKELYHFHFTLWDGVV